MYFTSRIKNEEEETDSDERQSRTCIIIIVVNSNNIMSICQSIRPMYVCMYSILFYTTLRRRRNESAGMASRDKAFLLSVIEASSNNNSNSDSLHYNRLGRGKNYREGEK